MFVEQLEKACREAVDSGSDCIVLVRKDGRTMLCGNRGPRGELLCENAPGEAVVRYRAKAVLAFIEREKARRFT